MTIYTTNKYDKFKKVPGNRAVYPTHVNALKRSILEHNLLADHPIQVTEDFKVIDGQHRLEAAKQLKLDIPYMVVKNATIDTIRYIQTQKAWVLEDYLHQYEVAGIDAYIRFRSFLNTADVPISVALTYLANTGETGTIKKEFKNGEFDFTEEDLARANTELQYTHILAPYMHSPSVANHKAFVSAMRSLFDHQVDMERLKTKAEEMHKVIYLMNSRREFLREIEDIYNYKSPNATRLYE